MSGSTAPWARVPAPCPCEGQAHSPPHLQSLPAVGRLHLVDLLPAVLVSYAQLGPVEQQQFTAAGVTPHHSRVEQRCQAPAVLVVGGAPEV